MAQDTRDKNQYPTSTTLEMFQSEYAHRLFVAIQSVEQGQMRNAITTLAEARHKGRNIFVAGNGGSASIAEHLECDIQKGCEVNKKTFFTRSLVSNPALLTAIANDIGYDQVFKYQLELLNPKPDDILILISSSGNSENILEAARFAHDKEMCVIGMTGFDGGDLKKTSDISLHIPIHNYGIVEDSHQALMHMIAQYLFLRISREQPLPS